MCNLKIRSSQLACVTPAARPTMEHCTLVSLTDKNSPSILHFQYSVDHDIFLYLSLLGKKVVKRWHQSENYFCKDLTYIACMGRREFRGKGGIKGGRRKPLNLLLSKNYAPEQVCYFEKIFFLNCNL